MSTPASSSSNVTKAKQAPTLAEYELVRKYDTENLIEFLKEQKDLQLDETHFKILCNEEISGCDFLKMTKDDFCSLGMTFEPALTLADFAKESYGTLQPDSLEAMQNEYIVALLHSALHIVRGETGKELIMRPQHEIIGDGSKGRVDYTIKHLEDLICITEDKQHRVPLGFARSRAASDTALSIEFTKKALEHYSKGVKEVLGVIVGLLKDRACVEKSPATKRARERYRAKML
ncbi:10619_t:CDS:2 [Paraglomus occultum]|uniref:10619_t:CDS:1 n=1 Tax=Paraglomus occultum TaxID=144539 RepID=A0A9N9G4U0_9GLOM|nr:10619_t:CDS:2 [Paraglomus occultum]